MIFFPFIVSFIMRGNLSHKCCPIQNGISSICPLTNSSLIHINEDILELTETLIELFDDDIITYISNIDLHVYLNTLQNQF